MRIFSHLSEKSSGSDTNIILDALSETTNSFRSDLQHLALTHSNTFNSISQSNKENRSSIQEISAQQNNLARLVGQLENDLGMLKQRQTMGVETLDHANSLSAKHQLWIGHADTVMNQNDMRLKMLQQQLVQVNMSTQNLVGRSELDATLGNFIGSNKSQWKGVSEAFEGRIGEVERMQTTIATEVASVRTGLEGLLGGGIGGVALEKSKFADAIFAKVEKMFEDRVGVVLEKILTDKAQKDKREEEVGGGSLRLELESCKKELARVGEELGKVKSGFKGDIERISVKADRNGKSIEDLAELNISDKDGASENDLALLKTEISSLEDTVKGLGEEIEGDRERSRAGQKTIGHAMVEMKEGVESVKSMLMQRGQEIEGIVREVKVLKDNEKKWMLGLGAVEKLGKLEKKLEVEKTGGDLALKKVADQMDKMSMTVSKLSVGMGREETERKESLEEVGLDLGVLKLKLGDVETGVGGYGGRIRVVEEEINVLKRKAAEVAVAEKKGAAVEKKKAHTVDDKLSVLQKRAAPSSPGRVLELSKNDDINDSFESDADELIHAANVERERKVGQKEEQAGLKSDVPVRKPKQVEEKPEAVKDEDDDFVTSCTSAPILGPLSSNYEVIEDIGFHRKSSIIGLGMVGGGDEASKVPRVGDRVKARWKGLRSWFKGVCIAVNDKNAEGGGGVMTWNVQYDDGAIDKFVKKDFIILDEDFYKGEGGKGGGSKKKDESASEGTTNAERKEKDELGESVKVMFPDHEFVKKWDAWHVREWIKSIVKLDDVAEKFHDKLMNGAMLLDKDWTPRDMEKNLSDPKDGMGIDNAQKRARVSAFIKALRETNIENRRARIRNYFNIWKDMDEVGDENEETNF